MNFRTSSIGIVTKMLGIAVLLFVAPIVYAQNLTIQADATNHTVTSFTATYRVTNAPSQVTKVYAWVGDVADGSYSSWNRNLMLTQFSATTPVGAMFSAEFNFAQSGLVTGKTYAYAITDRSAIPGAVFFQTPDHCFTVDAGVVPCPTGAGTSPSPSAAFSVTLESGTLTANAAGTYDKQFDITPDNALATAQTVELRIYATTNPTSAFATIPVTLPPGTLTTSPIAESLPVGSYTAAVYLGASKISPVVAFTVATPQQNPSPQSSAGNQNLPYPPNTSTTQAQNNVIGGVMVNFPNNLSTIGNNSATIVGVVSVQVPMEVSLSALSAVAGSPLVNPQVVFTAAHMEPGQTQNLTINFTGLAAGTKYEFAIKNNLSNIVSSPLNFTTTGGSVPGGVITYSGGLFPYTPPVISGSSQPGSNVSDTISDKGIVPKCGRSQNEEGTVPANELEMCGYDDFLQLIANIITFGIIILGPIAAIVILYAGFMIIVLSWNGDPTAEIIAKRKEYMALLLRVAVGVAIILSAWIIVATILRELGVKPAYILLDIFS